MEEMIDTQERMMFQRGLCDSYQMRQALGKEGGRATWHRVLGIEEYPRR